jgi:nucleoside-diphosphate-sugar epimerase
MHTEYPDQITNETQLDELLSIPSEDLVTMVKRLDGDIIILGIAGKIGITLGLTAIRAIKAAQVNKKVIGVARFSEAGVREQLEKAGIETITCDLLDRAAVDKLPQVKNVIFMAGRKFGTGGNEGLTWAMNVLVPANVAHHFANSRIIAFSTGCVYPLAPITSGGCTEADLPDPLGEYSQSCLGRERVFEHYSNIHHTPVCLLRLNYAIDLRYGVLYDIGKKVFDEQPIDLGMGHFNAIWQGDVNNQTLLALEYCQTPANVLNITGPETIPVKYVAEQFADLLGKKVTFVGETGSIALLGNSSKATALFGYPTVPLGRMIRWVAFWLMAGGRSLNKPTHFETSNGRY